MRHVLVIDDNDELRDAVAGVLNLSGFNVIDARDAETAIDLVKHQRPDLIICDVRMPGMDGYSLLGEIRNHSETASIPVILMTGSASKEDYRRGMVNGADDYLFKPFTPEELVEAVLSRISRQTDFEMDALNHAMNLSDRAVQHFITEASRPIDGIRDAVNHIVRKAGDLGTGQSSEDVRRINQSAMELDELAHRIAH